MGGVRESEGLGARSQHSQGPGSSRATQAGSADFSRSFAQPPSQLASSRPPADRTLSTGKMIDSYLSQKADLDDRAIHLLFSANRWERACVPSHPYSSDKLAVADAAPRRTQIVEDLRNGVTVVCDRYAFSGIAFSAIKVRSPPSTLSLRRSDEC